MLRLSNALVLALGACSGGLAVPVPRLVVETESVTFEEVQAGVRHRMPLTLTNAGTAPVRVRVVAAAPLIVTADAITLDSKVSASVDVILDVDTYEPVSAAIELVAGDTTVEVPVTATFDPDFDGDGVDAIGAGGTDCDDTRADVYPGADEVCDDVDNDCDGDVDELALDRIEVWPDADGDSWGSDVDASLRCSAGDGFVDRDGDCDDTDRLVNPDAVETADGVDEDCDGLVDEHLLTAGALLVTEIYLDPRGIDPAVPPYVELRASASTTLYLRGVVVQLGDATVTLDGGTASDADVLLLCGAGVAGSVGGLACDGPLPDWTTLDDRLAIRAEDRPLDAVDWSTWDMPGAASTTLDPSVRDPAGNDDPAAWCDATEVMSNGDRGSPGVPNSPCPSG